MIKIEKERERERSQYSATSTTYLGAKNQFNHRQEGENEKTEK